MKKIREVDYSILSMQSSGDVYVCSKSLHEFSDPLTDYKAWERRGLEDCTICGDFKVREDGYMWIPLQSAKQVLMASPTLVGANTRAYYLKRDRTIGCIIGVLNDAE